MMTSTTTNGVDKITGSKTSSSVPDPTQCLLSHHQDPHLDITDRNRQHRYPRRVSFADPLTVALEDLSLASSFHATMVSEDDNAEETGFNDDDIWNNRSTSMHLSREEKKRIRFRAFQRAYSILEESKQIERNSRITKVNESKNSNDVQDLEYGPILYRAHQSCRSGEPDLTEDEALKLTQWMIHCPTRRGLERLSVQHLRDEVQKERLYAVDAVLTIQAMAKGTEGSQSQSQSQLQSQSQSQSQSQYGTVMADETHQLTALIYAEMSAPSAKFARLLGTIDAVSVKYQYGLLPVQL